ncbi:unnamed protein product [Rangifer tarandus platyrhynchus]|uniref:Uncharacterized protein n=1 Tax=Rangifer tarandus platyrhynchus TaxID=3082113 RepID=A0ABN8XY15_RANTA|nr:unnamed protein product [Rangifer tarandus platyrhynchus]
MILERTPNPPIPPPPICSYSEKPSMWEDLIDNRFSMLAEAETDVDPLLVWQGCRDDGTVAPPFVKMVLEEDKLGNADWDAPRERSTCMLLPKKPLKGLLHGPGIHAAVRTDLVTVIKASSP